MEVETQTPTEELAATTLRDTETPPSTSAPRTEDMATVDTMTGVEIAPSSTQELSATEPQAATTKSPTTQSASPRSPAEKTAKEPNNKPVKKTPYGMVVKKRKKEGLSPATENMSISKSALNGDSASPEKVEQQHDTDSSFTTDPEIKKEKSPSPATSMDTDGTHAKGPQGSMESLRKKTSQSRGSQAVTERNGVKDEESDAHGNGANESQPPAQTGIKIELIEATEEACSTFEVIKECIYINRRLGDADQDGEIMQCECRANWDGEKNLACGENSDCINRATRMECAVEDCACGPDCQNMRFQKSQYADVSVVKAGAKGFGLMANTPLQANDFIYEYVGEVLDEPRFRKRMDQYDKAGIKHFYFMSLKGGEFIDATKKGGYGRFCNHSCNPNCYVDKWVVGDKLRMGIFAKRDIEAGEELVFDYNVDRYGADPQPCYCGEPNCVGFIGGKTQTDAAPRLSHHVIEALGLEDDSVFVGKKPRKPRKTGEADSDYVEGIPSKQLGEKDVSKVMSTLLGCKESWIIHKLLSRIDSSPDEAVPARVCRLHGYQILGRILHEFKHDETIVLLALGILIKFPRITKNKITSARIEPTVQELAQSENERIKEASENLLQLWSTLETAFRIPRRVGGNQNPMANVYNERQNKSRSKSKSPERPPPPTGPKAMTQQPLPPRGPIIKRPPRDLPWGWHKTYAPNQQVYYYSNDGQVTWWKPTVPCESRARLNGIPPPPTVPYVPLEREPLPENIAASERARKDKEFALQLQRELEEEARRKEQEIERRREQRAEEQRRKEEEEKALRRQRHKERAEYEKRKKLEHYERYIRKDMHNIAGKYTVRFLEGFSSEEIKKWLSKITDILVRKAMKNVNHHNEIDVERKKLFERKHLDMVKSWIEDYCGKLVSKRNEHKFSGTPTTTDLTPQAGPTPFNNSQSTTPVVHDGDTPNNSALATPWEKKAETETPTVNGDTPNGGVRSPEEAAASRKRSREDDEHANTGSPKRQRSPVKA